MWLWLLIHLLNPQHGPATCFAAGPVSDQEAEVLWTDGKADFESEKYVESALKLQRLVDRYPGYTGYLDAHLILGKAQLMAGKAEKAVAPLKYYISAKSRDPSMEPEAMAARIFLGRAYLEIGNFDSAYQTSLEVGNSATGKVDTTLQGRALLLRARSLIGLNQDARAERALSSSKPLLPANPEGAWIELKLKLRQCDRFPSPGRLEESEVRDQMERRGICLQEGLVLLKNSAELPTQGAENMDWTRRAAQEMEAAFKSYMKQCAHPPDPPVGRGAKKRSEIQLKRYRSELAGYLTAACRARLRASIDLMKNWNVESMPTRPIVEQTREALKGLHDRK